MTKAVTREDVMRLIQEYRQTFNPFADLHDEHLALEALELAITAIIEERDEAVAEAKSERAENQLHCACEFETRIEMLTKEHYEFPRVICKIHQDIVNDRDSWRLRAEDNLVLASELRQSVYALLDLIRYTSPNDIQKWSAVMRSADKPAIEFDRLQRGESGGEVKS